MIVNKDSNDIHLKNDNPHIIIWEDRYDTHIEHIDTQHKKLVDLINDLYHACLVGQSSADTVFKEAMSRMVEYVHFHFTEEQELLKRINYPEYHDHKNQHDSLIKDILEAAKEFDEGKKFVPNHFVRTLKDWVLSHIAVYDKNYALFIAGQKRKSLSGEE